MVLPLLLGESVKHPAEGGRSTLKLYKQIPSRKSAKGRQCSEIYTDQNVNLALNSMTRFPFPTSLPLVVAVPVIAPKFPSVTVVSGLLK